MITRIGAALLANILLTNKKIDQIIISEEEHNGINTKLSTFSQKDIIDIVDARATRDSATNKTILLFNTKENASNLTTRVIRSMGIVSNNEVVAIKNANRTVRPDEVLSLTYYMPIKLT